MYVPECNPAAEIPMLNSTKFQHPDVECQHPAGEIEFQQERSTVHVHLKFSGLGADPEVKRGGVSAHEASPLDFFCMLHGPVCWVVF